MDHTPFSINENRVLPTVSSKDDQVVAGGTENLPANVHEKLPAHESTKLGPKSDNHFSMADTASLGKQVLGITNSTDQAWKNLGGKVIGEPVVVSGDGKRLDIVVQGTDGNIYHKWRDGNKWIPSQTGYNKVGDVAGDGISAVTWGPNRLDIFARGKNNNSVWHRWWDGIQWHDWESLDGNATSKPVAVTWGVNRLDVFAQFTDGALWHKWWNGSRWEQWESLGGKILGAPSPVAWGPGRLDVSVRGVDKAIYHKTWDGSSWSGYGSLGGSVSSSPAEVSWGSGRLDIIVDGVDQNPTIFHKFWSGGGWKPAQWAVIGGSSISGPRVVAAKSNLLDIVIQGPDRAVWHKSWNGSSWIPAGTAWRSLGGSIDGPPVLSPLGSLRLEVFARGTNGDLMHWS